MAAQYVPGAAQMVRLRHGLRPRQRAKRLQPASDLARSESGHPAAALPAPGPALAPLLVVCPASIRSAKRIRSDKYLTLLEAVQLSKRLPRLGI